MVNRIFTGAIITIAKILIVGSYIPCLGIGDPSTTAAIKALEKLQTQVDTALSQNGKKYAMTVRYTFSASSYHACLEADVDSQIISFNKI